MSMAVLLAWSIALYTQHLYTWPRVLKERGVEERTGSNSLNFFQVIFTCCGLKFTAVLWFKVHSRRLLRACLLGSKRKLPLPACQVQLGLPYVVCCPRGVQFPGTVYICNQCPLSLDPTAFLVHPVLAATAEDSIPPHSSATDST